MKPWKNQIIFLSRDMSIGDVQIYVVSFRSIFVVDNHQPFYPSSNSLQKQQLISGSSVHPQTTTLRPTSSFTVIIDLRMYVFLTQEIQGRLRDFHHFLYAWFLIDSSAISWLEHHKTETKCVLFSQNTQFVIMKIRDPMILGI